MQKIAKALCEALTLPSKSCHVYDVKIDSKIHRGSWTIKITSGQLSYATEKSIMKAMCQIEQNGRLATVFLDGLFLPKIIDVKV